MNTSDILAFAPFSKSEFLYFYTYPESPDFTISNINFDIICSSRAGNIRISISRDNIQTIISCLKEVIFSSNKKIITWSPKGFFSIIASKTKHKPEINCKFIDLKFYESYHGIRQQQPKDIFEATNRLSKINISKNFEKIYNQVYLPLATNIIPDIETFPLISNGKVLNSHYELDGTLNGRAKCENKFINSYNPHTLNSKLINEFYSGYGRSDNFLLFDFKSMEVHTLAWLSNDETLKRILVGDFYSNLYNYIFNSDGINERIKKILRQLFLPTAYGQGAKSFAEIVNCSISSAENLIRKIKNRFPKAFNYLEDNCLKSGGICVDYFGRNRFFNNEDIYLSRNFLIQSPSVLFCNLALIRLHEAIRHYGNLVAYIHDGFLVSCSKSDTTCVSELGVKSLMESSDFFPDLSIPVRVKVGSFEQCFSD